MGNDYDDIEDSKNAKFNAGVLGTQRVNETLKLINFCKSNPLAYNADYCDWNFIIWFRNIIILYGEIDGFLSFEERDACFKMKEKILYLMKKYPIRETKRIGSPNNIQTAINEGNWDIIMKAIETYELVVKRYGVDHSIIASISDSGLEGL